jgi:NAD-dependent deacetylase
MKGPGPQARAFVFLGVAMIGELAQAISRANRVCLLTGAGASTESGIPDFRSPGGIWSQYRIVEYGEFISSEAARLEDWRRRFAMEDRIGEVAPGAAHRFAAWLVKTGKADAIVTQNIDGLHQQAGLAEGEVVEIHGNARHALCLDCGLRHEIAQCRGMMEATGEAPRCMACGGIVKSAVVMFGEAMPHAAFARAEELAAGCDLFIAMGTSLQVFPAASLPMTALRTGAQLAIVNREATPLDIHAGLILRGRIGDMLAREGIKSKHSFIY